LVTLSSSMFTSVNEATNVKVSSKCFIIIFIMVIYATLKFVKQVISHKETNYEMDMVIYVATINMAYSEYGSNIHHGLVIN